MIQLYTGNGKGKTTAALGLAMRAAGHGMKVAFIQFMKGWEYGELRSAEKIPGFTIFQYGRASFVSKENPAPEDVELARQGLNKAKEVIASGDYDLIVLDEINVAVDFNLIKIEEVMELLKGIPEGMEIVCTGRYARREMIEAADLVTEMLEVKHPFNKNISGRKGIDF